MTTPRDDISGLSERLRAPWKDGEGYFVQPSKRDLEAATQLDSLLKERDALQARVKELEERTPEAIAKENASLKTWIDLHRGDVMSLSNEVDHFRSELEASESRATRLRQERDEAYERAAKVAEEQAVEFLSPQYASEQPFGSICERFACEEVAKAIRRLAGPEKEKTSASD